MGRCYRRVDNLWVASLGSSRSKIEADLVRHVVHVVLISIVVTLQSVCNLPQLIQLCSSHLRLPLQVLVEDGARHE